MRDVLRQRPRIAVADPILTHPLTLAIFPRQRPGRDGTVRSGLKSTKQDIGLNARHARPLRDALARHVRGTRAKTVPGDQPGRTQDTGDRADGTAVRGRARRRASR